MTTCACPCHRFNAWQVCRDALPSIEAVTACDACVNAHCAVLLERKVWWDAAPDPLPYIAPPSPAEFCNPEE